MQYARLSTGLNLRVFQMLCTCLHGRTILLFSETYILIFEKNKANTKKWFRETIQKRLDQGWEHYSYPLSQTFRPISDGRPPAQLLTHWAPNSSSSPSLTRNKVGCHVCEGHPGRQAEKRLTAFASTYRPPWSWAYKGILIRLSTCRLKRQTWLNVCQEMAFPKANVRGQVFTGEGLN